MRRMTCYTCAHARTVYDKHGLVLGVECSADSMRFKSDRWIRERGGCIEWTEAEEE